MNPDLHEMSNLKNLSLPILFYIIGTTKNSTLYAYHLGSKIEKSIEIYSSKTAVDGDILGNVILIAGGVFNNKMLGTTQKILILGDKSMNIFDLSIVNCANLNFPRTYLAMIGINQSFYSIGGCSDENITLERYCEMYDMKKDIWTIKPDLNFPNSSMTVLNIEDRFIYTFGGFNEDKIQKYDTFIEDQWEIIQILYSDSKRYFGKGLELFDGRYLILGGGHAQGLDLLIFNQKSKNLKNLNKSFEMSMAFSANRPIVNDASIYAISCIQKKIKIDLNKSFLLTEQNNHF